MAKKAKPTHHDAELILKLYDLRREATMRKARDFQIRWAKKGCKGIAAHDFQTDA